LDYLLSLCTAYEGHQISFFQLGSRKIRWKNLKHKLIWFVCGFISFLRWNYCSISYEAWWLVSSACICSSYIQCISCFICLKCLCIFYVLFLCGVNQI
jgi:hypothetical protein